MTNTTYTDYTVGDKVILRGEKFGRCQGTVAVVIQADSKPTEGGIRHGRAQCGNCGHSHGFHNDSRADLYRAEPVTPDETTVTFQDEDYLVIINGAKMKEDMRNFINVHRKHGWIPNEELLYPNIADTHVEMFCPTCQFVYTIKRTVFEQYGR